MKTVYSCESNMLLSAMFFDVFPPIQADNSACLGAAWQRSGRANRVLECLVAGDHNSRHRSNCTEEATIASRNHVGASRSAASQNDRQRAPGVVKLQRDGTGQGNFRKKPNDASNG